MVPPKTHYWKKVLKSIFPQYVDLVRIFSIRLTFYSFHRSPNYRLDLEFTISQIEFLE